MKCLTLLSRHLLILPMQKLVTGESTGGTSWLQRRSVWNLVGRNGEIPEHGGRVQPPGWNAFIGVFSPVLLCPQGSVQSCHAVAALRFVGGRWLS